MSSILEPTPSANTPISSEHSISNGVNNTPLKKILYVITKANWGGAQRYVYDIASAAKAAGHDVSLAYGESGRLNERLEEDGIRTIAISSLSRDVGFGRELASYQALLALFKEEKPDIVHVNSSKGGLALLAARVAGVPKIIFTAHGWAFNENRPWWQRFVLHGIYALTVYLAHITICVSDAIRRDVAWLPAHKKLVVIRHGIEAPVFKSKKAARTALFPKDTGAPLIGMLAELHPTKRIEDAIDALALLKDSHPDLVLIVLGDGRHRAELESRILARGIPGRVFLKGFVADAATLLKGFDVFLMPSRSEALGYALIEAGYAALPVIGSRVGGIPEVVRHKHTGLLVPRGNPHALARAIRTYIEEREYAKEMGSALATSVEEKFNTKRMLEETLALYL